MRKIMCSYSHIAVIKRFLTHSLGCIFPCEFCTVVIEACLLILMWLMCVCACVCVCQGLSSECLAQRSDAVWILIWNFVWLRQLGNWVGTRGLVRDKFIPRVTVQSGEHIRSLPPTKNQDSKWGKRLKLIQIWSGKLVQFEFRRYLNHWAKNNAILCFDLWYKLFLHQSAKSTWLWSCRYWRIH